METIKRVTKISNQDADNWIDSVKYLWISVERLRKTFQLYALQNFLLISENLRQEEPGLSCIFNLNISKETTTNICDVSIYLILMFWNWPKSEAEIFIFTLLCEYFILEILTGSCCCTSQSSCFQSWNKKMMKWLIPRKNYFSLLLATPLSCNPRSSKLSEWPSCLLVLVQENYRLYFESIKRNWEITRLEDNLWQKVGEKNGVKFFTVFPPRYFLFYLAPVFVVFSCYRFWLDTHWLWWLQWRRERLQWGPQWWLVAWRSPAWRTLTSQ